MSDHIFIVLDNKRRKLSTTDAQIEVLKEKIERGLPRVNGREFTKAHRDNEIQEEIKLREQLEELQRTKRMEKFERKLGKYHEKIKKMAKELPDCSEDNFPQQTAYDERAKKDLIALCQKFLSDSYSSQLYDDVEDEDEEWDSTYCKLCWTGIEKTNEKLLVDIDTLGKLLDDKWETYNLVWGLKNDDRIRGLENIDDRDKLDQRIPSGYPNEVTSTNILFYMKQLSSYDLDTTLFEISTEAYNFGYYELARDGLRACIEFCGMLRKTYELIEQNREDKSK